MNHLLKISIIGFLTVTLWYCSKSDPTHDQTGSPSLSINDQIVSRDSFATDSCGHYDCAGTLTLLSESDSCWYLVINGRKVCTKNTDPACLVSRYRSYAYGCSNLPPYPKLQAGVSKYLPIYDEGTYYFRAYGPPGLQLKFKVTSPVGVYSFIVKNANIYGPTIESFECDISKTGCPGGDQL